MYVPKAINRNSLNVYEVSVFGESPEGVGLTCILQENLVYTEESPKIPVTAWYNVLASTFEQAAERAKELAIKEYPFFVFKGYREIKRVASDVQS